MKKTLAWTLIHDRAVLPAVTAALIAAIACAVSPAQIPAQTPAQPAQTTPPPIHMAQTVTPPAPPAQTPPTAQTAPTTTTKNLAVSDKVFVDSGDTKLYVEIRGQKKTVPVVLVLHEGPGNAVGILAFEAYPGAELEKNYIVAYLHQRGVLRSPAVPAASQTLANHVRDVDSVVEYLKKRFGERTRLYRRTFLGRRAGIPLRRSSTGPRSTSSSRSPRRSTWRRASLRATR